MKNTSKIIINGKEYQVTCLKKNVKRMTIKILSNLDIIVTINNRCKIEKAYDFLNTNINWVEKTIDKQSKFLVNTEYNEVLSLNKYYLLGKLYDVVKSNNFEVTDNIIYTNNNIDLLIFSKYDFVLREIFEEVRKKDFSYINPILKIKCFKSKWGSCKYKENQITLNYRLLHLPFEVIKYVIYHEFVHFKIQNHSKEFYNQLNKYCPNYLLSKKCLKKYSFLLML